MTDPKAVLRRLEEIRAQTLRYLDRFGQEQLDWRLPSADGKQEWSLGEILMHLAIDEIYLREVIALPLLQGIQPPAGVGFLPPPPPYGTRKDVIEFWFERARWQTRRLFDDWPAGARLDLRHEGGLEAMNGLDWLEGYAGHEAYHHRQIEAVLAQLPEVPRE
ncbi:MAG: DinB family protein [Anaerolineales bacterium]